MTDNQAWRKKIDKAITCDKDCGHKLDPEICYQHQIDRVIELLANVEVEARIDENQRYIDKADEYNNREVKPGELTPASFGVAGAGMVAKAYYNSFKDRIIALQSKENQ